MIRARASIIRVLLLGIILAIAWPAVGCLSRSSEQPSKLTYKLPTTITVALGDVVPGTDIRYDHMDDKGAYLIIDGQQALKRKGDSLQWSGSLRDGVAVVLKLRVVWYAEEELRLAGTAKITIEDLAPSEGDVVTTSSIKYSGPVAYGLAKGAIIPGTSLSYVGSSDDGAELGGVQGYAYRRTGDSVLWEGTLRNGVYLQLDMRVLQYDDKGLRVGGLATLWIGE